MTMAEKEHPKLTRKPSRAKLHKSASRLFIDTGTKTKPAHYKDDEKEGKNELNEENHTSERIKQNDNNKKSKKGKKKEKGKKDKKEEINDTEENKIMTQADGMAERRENFRIFIYDKVRTALSVVYLDGVTNIDTDNVTPLMKSLDVATGDESFVDLLRKSVLNNSGVIAPLELDALVMSSQEENVFVDVDECLETAFNLIDIDADGFITQKDLRRLMMRLGETLGDYTLDDMLKAVDIDNDGKISLRDFRCFLLGKDVPSKKEIEAKENARKTMEAKKAAERAAKEHEGDEENGTKYSAPRKKFRKLQYAIKGLKLIPETNNFSRHINEPLIEDDDSFSVASTRADGQRLKALSPRTADSVIKKKLFFGGFINKSRVATNGVVSYSNNDLTKKGKDFLKINADINGFIDRDMFSSNHKEDIISSDSLYNKDKDLMNKDKFASNGRTYVINSESIYDEHKDLVNMDKFTSNGRTDVISSDFTSNDLDNTKDEANAENMPFEVDKLPTKSNADFETNNYMPINKEVKIKEPEDKFKEGAKNSRGNNQEKSVYKDISVDAMQTPVFQVRNSDASLIKSPQDNLFVEDMEDFDDERARKEGPMPIVEDNLGLYIPPPDMSIVDPSSSYSPPDSPRENSAIDVNRYSFTAQTMGSVPNTLRYPDSSSLKHLFHADEFSHQQIRNVSGKGESSHQRAQTVAERSVSPHKPTRTVPDKAEMLHQQTRAVPEKSEILHQETRALSEKAEMLHQQTRAVPEKSALSHQNMKAVPDKVDLSYQNTITVTEKAESPHEQTRAVPDKVELSYQNTIIVPEKAESPHEQTRAVPDKVELSHDNMRTIPSKVELSHLHTRTVPNKIELPHHNTRTVPDTVELSHLHTGTVPNKAELSYSHIRSALPKPELSHKETRIVPDKFESSDKQGKSMPDIVELFNQQTKAIPKKAELSHQKIIMPNKSSSFQHHRRHSNNNKNREETYSISSSEDTEDASDKLVLKLRRRRKSNSSPKSALNAHSTERVEHGPDRRHSLQQFDKEMIDPDEGIELVDEEIRRRELHIPLAQKASSTSLRIYLSSKEDVAQGNDPSGDEKSRISKPRPRITIDLKNFSVDDEDDEEMIKNHYDRNFNKNDDYENNSNGEDEVDNVNEKLDYSSQEDSICAEDSNEIDEHEMQEINQRSLLKRTTFRPKGGTQSEDDSEDKMPISQKFKEKLQDRFHTKKHEHQRNDINKEDTVFIKHSPGQKPQTQKTYSYQEHVEQTKSTKSKPSYHQLEKKEHAQITSTTFKQHPKGQMLVPNQRDTLKIPWADDNDDKNIQKTDFESKHGRFLSKPHVKKIHYALKLEKPVPPSTTYVTFQEPKLLTHRTPKQNKLLAPRDPPQIMASSKNDSNNMPNVDRRKLHRFNTSFEIQTPRDLENEPNAGANDSAKLLPKRRSFSASDGRSIKASHDVKYHSVSVIDLTELLQIETANRSNSYPKRYFTSSNIVPLSKIVHGAISSKARFVSPNISQLRQNNKNCVPYFLHDSFRNTNLAPEIVKYSTNYVQKKKRKGNKKKRTYFNVMDADGLPRVPRDEDVATLLSELRDPDMIPNEVIVNKLKQFTSESSGK